MSKVQKTFGITNKQNAKELKWKKEGRKDGDALR